MNNKKFLKSIASIRKRIGGDLGSPNIDSLFPGKDITYTGELITAPDTLDGYSGNVTIKGKTIKTPTGLHSMGLSGNMELISCNKNIVRVSDNFTIENVKYDAVTTKVSIVNGIIHIRKLTDVANQHVLIGDPLFFKKGTKYYVNMQTPPALHLAIHLKDIDFVYSGIATNNKLKTIEFVCREDQWLSLALTTSSLNIADTISVENVYVGTVPMGDVFTPHIENRINITLNKPLHSVPYLNICDTIVSKGGRKFIKREVGRVDFNASNMDQWEYHGSENDVNILFVNLTALNKSNLCIRGMDSTLFTSHSSLMSGQQHQYIYSINNNTRGVSISDACTIYIKFKKGELLASDTLQGLKDYITANPFYILYPLKEPIYEDLNISSLQLEMYTGQTNIVACDDVINTEITIDVPTNILSILNNDMKKLKSLENDLVGMQLVIMGETLNLISIDEQLNNHKNNF